MSDLPPGPYTYEIITAKATTGQPIGNGHVYITDATGRKIASIWGKPAEKMALAELICNARDKAAP